MASWVAPTVAAEMWKMSVAEILARINHGELQSKQEGGFTFVDIDSADPARLGSHSRITPPTFTVLTSEEERALLDPIDYNIARKIVSCTRKRPMAA